MLSTDREEFEVQLKILCAGYDKPIGDRTEAYWKGLAKMSLLEFARVVEYALGEDGPDKIPTTKHCWAIRNDLKRGRTVTRQVVVVPEGPYSKWLARINGLFLRYILQRRDAEKFMGDINILARRRECLELRDYFEHLELEFGSEPPFSELKRMFDSAMIRVKDQGALTHV
jgi:hypothetical protein